MRASDKPHAAWPARCAEWLKAEGLASQVRSGGDRGQESLATVSSCLLSLVSCPEDHARRRQEDPSGPGGPRGRGGSAVWHPPHHTRRRCRRSSTRPSSPPTEVGHRLVHRDHAGPRRIGRYAIRNTSAGAAWASSTWPTTPAWTGRSRSGDPGRAGRGPPTWPGSRPRPRPPPACTTRTSSPSRGRDRRRRLHGDGVRPRRQPAQPPDQGPAHSGRDRPAGRTARPRHPVRPRARCHPPRPEAVQRPPDGARGPPLSGRGGKRARAAFPVRRPAPGLLSADAEGRRLRAGEAGRPAAAPHPQRGRAGDPELHGPGAGPGAVERDRPGLRHPRPRSHPLRTPGRVPAVRRRHPDGDHAPGRPQDPGHSGQAPARHPADARTDLPAVPGEAHPQALPDGRSPGRRPGGLPDRRPRLGPAAGSAIPAADRVRRPGAAPPVPRPDPGRGPGPRCGRRGAGRLADRPVVRRPGGRRSRRPRRPHPGRGRGGHRPVRGRPPRPGDRPAEGARIDRPRPAGRGRHSGLAGGAVAGRRTRLPGRGTVLAFSRTG